MTDPIRENDPKPGFYRRRLVRGGPWVPARIWIEPAERVPCDECDGSGRHGFGPICHACNGEGKVPIHDDLMYCEVNGEPRDPFDQWLWLAGHPITEVEYWQMRGLDSELADAAPDASAPINLHTLPPAGPPRKEGS